MNLSEPTYLVHYPGAPLQTLFLHVVTAAVSVLVVIGISILFLVGVKWLLKKTE